MRKIMFYSKKPWERRQRTSHDKEKGKLLKNSTDILLYSQFTCGVIVGSALYYSNNALQYVLSIIADLLISKHIPYLLINGFCIHLFLLLICIFLAYSCFGALPMIFVCFCRGICSAFAVSRLSELYGYKGFGYYLLILMPGTVLSVCATLELCKTSIYYSRAVNRLVLQGDNADLSTKHYRSAVLIYLALIMVSLAADCVLTFLFAGLF